MKKYIIIAAVFTACLALCAVVWPQSEKVEETPAPIQVAAVNTPEPTVEDIAVEVEITPSAEDEKIDISQPQAEPIHEPESVPEEIAVTPEVQPKSEPVAASEPTSVAAPSQAVTDPQPGDMVYVPGFGWLKSQGLGEVIYAEDMYENGNKVGSME